MQQLTYGSLISISHVDDEDALICADGFIKSSVILKGMLPTEDHDISKQFKIQNSLFIICPKFSNAQKTEIASKLPKPKEIQLINDEETAKKSDNLSQSFITQVKSVSDKFSEKNIRDDQIKLFNEFKFNIEAFVKEQGQRVAYDQQVQFLHLASSKWLSCTDEVAKFENQNYKLELSEFTSETTLFKIIPAFKYQKEGDQSIYSNEIVRIIRAVPISGKPLQASQKSNTYLHSSGEKVDVKKNSSFVGNINKINKREVNASQEEATFWKINQFASDLSQGPQDLIWIHHSETCSQLAIEHEFDINKMKVSVHQSNMAELSFDNFSGNAYSLWIIEPENSHEGGPFSYKTSYRLKHFSSGLYLACVRIIPKKSSLEQSNQNQPNYGKKLVSIPKSSKVPASFTLQVIPDRNSLFEFQPLKISEKEEIGTDFIQIRNIAQNKYLDVINKFVPDRSGDQQQGQTLKPVILNQKNEHAVFKLFKANNSATQEILFLDSSLKQITKYFHYITKEFSGIDQEDSELLKIKQNKIKIMVKTITMLEDFIQQKIFNSSPNEKFGNISHQRQKLFKDLHFFDLLIIILVKSISKDDIDKWSNQKQFKQEIAQVTGGSTTKKKKGITEKDRWELAVSKVQLGVNIFKLLQTASQSNTNNQLDLYRQLPQYQHFCKYMQEAVYLVIQIVRSNESILLELGSSLRIDFDYEKQEIVQDEYEKKVKILINFYEKETMNPKDQPIPFKVHDRIITKPINIINYFFNLLLDNSALNKEDYVKFLSSVCRYKQGALSINQENMFKLYTWFSAQRDLFNIDFQNINKNAGQINKKDIKLIQELIEFYSEVCYGRNYIWKHKLSDIFPKEFLFGSIWHKENNQQENIFRPYWCKLASNLYVDQQPYTQYQVPNFCRLFTTCDSQQLRVQKQVNFNFQLILKYLKEQKSRIKDQIKSGQRNFNILNDELTINTTDLILKMLHLDIFPEDQFAKLIKYIIHMFIYDRKNLKYIEAALLSYKKVVKDRITKQKGNLPQFGFISMSDLISFNKQNPVSSEQEVEKEDQNLFDQPQLFLNPIMRGFMTLSYKLEDQISIPKSRLEIEFKLKVCSILDNFLDRRQNFLITNILTFFKRKSLEDEDFGSDDEDGQQRSYSQKMFEEYYKTLLPNIARTGIESIDEIQQEQQGDLLSLQFNKPQTFVNYCQQYKVSDQEAYEIDSYFSKSYYKEQQKSPVASVLPYLLSTYYLVKDRQLEERCLNVIMRIFNQREELQKNIQQVQIIFEDNMTLTYQYIEKNLNELRNLIEQTEIWLSSYKVKQINEVTCCYQIIRSLTACMFQNVRVIDDEELIIEDENKKIVDERKQQIMNFLKVHEQVISLIKNGMGHLIEVLNNPKLDLLKKQQLTQLFQQAFQFVTIFCQNNKNNQLIVFQEIETIFLYLSYDVGQIDLLISIYNNNSKLLNNNQYLLIDKITQTIDREGRQSKYLDILINTIKLDDNYILENQIALLNKFLPMKQMNEKELRLIYAEGSKSIDFQFYLEDIYIPKEQDLLDQLQSVDWKDTYKDEPFKYHSKLLDMLIQLSLSNVSARQFRPDAEKEGFYKDAFNISVFKIQKAIKASYLIWILQQQDSMVRIQQKKLKLVDILKVQKPDQQEEEGDPDKEYGFTYLKPVVVEFLRLIHINCLKQNIQEQQISLLNTQLIILIEQEIRKMDAILNEFEHSNYMEYLVDYFVPFLISYHEKIITMNQADVAKVIQNFSNRFVLCIKQVFLPLLSTKLQYQIIEKFKFYYNNKEYDSLFMKDSDQNLLHLKELVDEEKEEEIEIAPIQQHQSKSGQKKESLFGSNIFSSVSKKLSKPKKSKQNAEFRNNSQWEEQWNMFALEMQKSSLMSEQIELERQALADAFTKVESLITESCEIKPNLESILKKLINFLSLAVLEPENKGTIVILLKIMCKIIEKEEDQIEKYQILFDNLGATRMVLNVITDYAKLISPDMLYNLLTFINVLLKNGNKQVQKTIYNFCLTQQKSEIIFQTFSKYIKQATTSQSNENEDEQEVEMRKDIVNAILKFLQNCAEGHYLDLQNYIRFQTNSRASIDMINLVADLFKNYERTPRNFSNLLRCLDTLNELVQGPCSENQIAVADSKFFDVVQEMFPQRKGNEKEKSQGIVKASSGKKKSSKFVREQLSKGMKAQLQNKILILVLSLLENREIKGKNSIIKRIMRVIPVVVIEKFLSKCYKKWNIIYQNDYIMEAFDHVKLDPEDDQFKDPKNKAAETIIQNGFYLMFLFCYYQESEEAIDSPFKHYNKQYLKSQNKENSIIDPNSTIGQILTLLQELYDKSVQKTQEMIMQAKRVAGNEEEFELERQKQKIENKKKRLRKSFMFFRSKTAHIEVIRDQNELVFFPLLPFSKLNKDEKSQFQQNVNRTSAKAKVQDLLERSNEFIEIMQHEEKMRRVYQQWRIIGFFATYIQLWKDIAYYLTLIINIFILGSYALQRNSPSNGDPLQDVLFFQNHDWNAEDTKQLFFTLGIIMMICSLFVVIFVLAKIAPLIIKKALKKQDVFQGGRLIHRLLNWLVKFFFVLFSCLYDFTLLYYLGYGVLSVLGTFVHPFFFCFHLTVILIRYPTLSNVVKAVTQPKVQLLLTLLLIIILTYIYTLIAYFALQEDYGNNCKSVLYCFLQIFDMNFKVPGGIGGQMTQANASPDYKPVRYIFDQTNNLLLVIIMISIAAGIIIDTFGQLREEENQMQSDIKDKCFICGQENIVFEKSEEGSSGGFQNHIRQNHYMWNYLYYIAYLKQKDPQDYSGIESYVAQKIIDTDLSWIPFNKARELERGEDESEKLEKQIEEVSNDFGNMIDNAEQIKEIIKSIKDNKDKKNERHHSQGSTVHLKTQQQ